MNDILTISEHQEILVSSKRDVQNNIISYEDRELLFDIKYTDKKDKERYIISNNGKNKIKANSIVGSISLKTGLTVEILPKFAKNDLDEKAIKKHRKMLLNILRVSNEQNFISSSSQSSKVLADEMPLLHYVIELFSAELLHTLRTGVYATYNKKVENSSHVRGNILISKSIQNNIIDKSKVYVSYNKHSSNNLLMQVFRTLVKILLNDNNLSYKAKQTLHEVYLLLDGVDIIPLKQQDFKSITFNRLNDKFEILFRQAEFIFNRYMPFSSHINSTPFWAILFDMNYLFEKFCAYLFRRSGLEVEEQNMTKCFDNHKSIVSAKPDFVIKGNRNLFDTEIISVVDAKWKLLSNDKSLYGLDAQNFWQLFSYMNLLNHNKALHGYFIVPKNSKDFEDEIIFTPLKEGNKSITILSIDFSLSFEELIEKYRFKIINDELKLDVRLIENKIEEIILVEEEIENELKIIELEEEYKFNFEEFIDELESLHNNKNLVKLLSPAKKDERFRNIFYLKDKEEVNSSLFKRVIKENLTRENWNLGSLEITAIPNNIIKLKKLIILSLKDNELQLLPMVLFKLKHLEKLNLSKNYFSILPNEIKDLKKLKQLSIDKEIVEENIALIAELRKNNVFIADEEDNDLSEYINSFIAVNESKNTEIGFKQDKVIEPENIKEHIDETIKPIITTPKVIFEKTTIDDYKNMDDDKKMRFLESVDFNMIDTDFIEFIVKNESNIDRLEDFTYNKTLPLKYLVLTHTHHSESSQIKENIKKRDKVLYDMIGLNIFGLTNYIDKNFTILDKEIVLGYAMSQGEKLHRVREIISVLTNDLDVLNELSKHKGDQKVLENIVFKTKDNDYFKQLVKNKDTIYSLEILDKIARYEEYYEVENNFCLIAKLARNFSLLEETKEYLFEQYKNDRVFLEALSKNKSSWELQNKVKSALYGSYSETINDEVFNGIDFK